MLIDGVVRDGKYVKKRVGKRRQHFDVYLLHIPMKKTLHVILYTGYFVHKRQFRTKTHESFLYMDFVYEIVPEILHTQTNDRIKSDRVLYEFTYT